MKKMILVLAIVTAFILVGVVINYFRGSRDSEKHKTTDYSINTIAAGKDIIIEKNAIDGQAKYYNYVTEDGVTIQLFAVKGTDDKIRILFNTCGACNPSPTSYFVQEGDYFVCQTCGNRFHVDDIGLEKAIGCAPMAILDEDKQINNQTITISSKFIETYKDKFVSINIYEKEN